MRQSLLRRVVAALFVIVGLGVASSALPADAAPTHVTQHPVMAPNDWNWN